jgi:hypothetical protein
MRRRRALFTFALCRVDVKSLENGFLRLPFCRVLPRSPHQRAREVVLSRQTEGDE